MSAAFQDAPAEFRTLIEGVGGSSPYLGTLALKDRKWLLGTAGADPEESFCAILDALDGAAPDTVAGELRKAKRRVALLAGLADLGGVWNLEDVTGRLTAFADKAVECAFGSELQIAEARRKFPEIASDRPGDHWGMAIIAMGKMGAYELNYSSDIDLICLFDDSRFAPGDLDDIRQALVRVTRRAAALLSDITADGYVFRTDLRLRPDPAVTPVCLSMSAAERYYESVGRTWERAAYIKARAAALDTRAGAAFLELLSPFVWRKHLDFAAIQDAHDIRKKIRHQLAGPRSDALDARNIKMASGGIREIEFFTQTRQLIAGGRDPSLRLRGTVDGLRALARKGWIADASGLIEDYRAHRELEHRLQMIADQQTHSLPRDPDGWGRLAALMDRDLSDLRAEIAERIQRVAAVTEGFFAPGQKKTTPEISKDSAEIIARWPSYPALRSARAVEIFERVRPEILTRLQTAARPEEALARIDRFLAGLPAGVQLFSLFDANPQLIDLIVDIAATSPALAGYLSRHSDVLDAVIDGAFFSPWPDRPALAASIEDQLSSDSDYESMLLAARRWRNEWHFRAGVHHLRGLVDGRHVAGWYSDIAEAILSALWPRVAEEFARKHGPPPGRGAMVLGMGSLGSAELNSQSDLDLIVIYDPLDMEQSDGPRPLGSRAYYARLTQGLITALTAMMGPGRLYEVDMRLRPSGRKGPVATSLEAFRTYQRNDAWTWEHLALTRARPVAGSEEIGEDIARFRVELLSGHRERDKTMEEVRDMRERLARAKGEGDFWDPKTGPGRLQDISLLAQAAALLAGAADRDIPGQLHAAEAQFKLSRDERETLERSYALFWSVQAVQRLVSEAEFSPETFGEGGRRFLLREVGADDLEQVSEMLRSASQDASAIIDRALESRPE